MAAKILLVDDEIDILDMLGEFLVENGYAVDTAQNGVEALQKLEKSQYDLLLSDINMPQMKGFELLKDARERFPKLKSALITAYNVNDYVRMACEQDVGNIITKTSPFNFEEVRTVVKNLIDENVFGIERYMDPDAEIQMYEIHHSKDIDTAVDNALVFFGENRAPLKVNVALREVVTNAVFYGAKNERGDQKELWDIDVALTPDEYVKVYYARDKDKVAASVVDAKGRLKKKDALYWLYRNLARYADGTPSNINDIHGRGLFISRETIDRFIINIKRGERTEVIAIQFLGDAYKGYRPLMINEF